MSTAQCLFVGILVVQTLFGARYADADEARFIVHVQDETGTSIPSATVRAGFGTSMKAGTGWGTVQNLVSEETDENGFAAFNGTTDSFVDVDAQKPGFYPTYGSSIRFTNTVRHKLQPWNPTIELMLLRVIDPVPMYAKHVEYTRALKGPSLPMPTAYDLMQGDWVAPCGKGQSTDVVFYIQSKPTQTATNIYGTSSILPDMTLTVTVPGDGNGLQVFYVKPYQGSHLRLPRTAPQQGYTNHWVRRFYRPGVNEPVQGDSRSDQNFIFRVRSVMESGQVVRAMYGKIHGDIEFSDKGELRFTYYLNPNTASRSLEFDLNQNLFTNLPDLEQVREP